MYLGRSYVEDKENEKAMKVYLQALDIALRSEDYNQAGYICSYMGDLYDFEGNYLLGKDKYKEAESYFEKRVICEVRLSPCGMWEECMRFRILWI